MADVTKILDEIKELTLLEVNDLVKALEEDAVAFCKKALDYDLVLVPSDSFGVPGYFRMAYCIDTEKVERSLVALRKFVKENY